jgi:hypothetical protein
MNHFRISKMADLETLLPGFKTVWPAIKAACGTGQRHPKSVYFTDKPHRAILNDSDSGKRFSLNLATMKLEGPALHISGGEWACHAGSNHDNEVVGVPTTHALLTCTYNDYYRTFTMYVQVAKLPEKIAEQATV